MAIVNRRQFVGSLAMSAAGVAAGRALAASDSRSPNEKLNVAVIGCGGRGAGNLAGVAGENIVALCDVDQNRAAAAFAKFPRAKKYSDFRKMFDQLQHQIDAVVVSTPDHTHAPATAMACIVPKFGWRGICLGGRGREPFSGGFLLAMGIVNRCQFVEEIVLPNQAMR
jgi:Zn-dependent alcohol dehydrogenase